MDFVVLSHYDHFNKSQIDRLLIYFTTDTDWNRKISSIRAHDSY